MSQFGSMGTEHGVWRRRASQASWELLAPSGKPRPLRPGTRSGMASMRWLSKQFAFSRRSSTQGLKGARALSAICKDRLRGMNEPESAVWDGIPHSGESFPNRMGRTACRYIYIYRNIDRAGRSDLIMGVCSATEFHPTVQAFRDPSLHFAATVFSDFSYDVTI
jgi:hypothetical protein